MRVPLNWLGEHVELPHLPLAELCDWLTAAGLEVEGVTPLGPLAGVVVGQVMEVAPHPNTDHLAVCRVDAGDAVHTVVCGAPNLEEGALVPLALPGAQIPSGQVAAARIRGVTSTGMILSRAELRLEERSAGIWNLPPAVEVGAELAPLVEVPDTVLDIAVTANRPDLLGVYGLAREVAALWRVPLRELKLDFPEGDQAAAELTDVQIESGEDCPRYVARAIQGVSARSSPLWLEARLLKAGMRPVSLVVDTTNYVMLETGHPLHAFDHARLQGGRIQVRRPRRGERIRTLDGVERELPGEVLVIADASRPVAVAGVMGGEETEVSPATRCVLLESACFSPVRVRRSSRALGVRTEASLRFERGLSPEGAELASRRFCALLTALAPFQVARGAVDAYPQPTRQRAITLRRRSLTRHLGVEVPPSEVRDGLAALGLTVTEEPAGWQVGVPPFRGDLRREIDVVEEVARLHGYGRIPARPPRVSPHAGDKPPLEQFVDQARQVASALGLVEVYTPPLVPRAEGQVTLRNPTGENQEALRASLLPGLLRAVQQNLEAQAAGVALFEVGRVFSWEGKEIAEDERLGVALAGRPSLPLSGKDDYGPAQLKGLLEGLLAGLRVGPAAVGECADPRLHPSRRAAVLLGSRRVGWLGEVNPDLTQDLPGGRRVLALELRLAPLAEARRPPRHRPTPRFPAAKRDLSLLAPQTLPEAEVREVILAEPYVESCLLYDLYAGAGVPAGRRSLNYEVAFRHPQRTLASEEVDEAVGRILARLEELGAELRT
ncbi:MAG: phenylalanine--tRNA ligase subunit beta [Candidatus Bipolaricaulaceae bacterium]